MRTLALWRNDLKIVFRDRAQLAVLFIMPLAFIIPISLALGSGDGYDVGPENTRISLPLADHDRGDHARALHEALAESVQVERHYPLSQAESLGLAHTPACAQVSAACDERVARELLQRSRRTAALVIPADFSAAIDTGQPAEISLLYDPVADAATLLQIQGVLEGAATRISLAAMVDSGFVDMNALVAFAPEAVQRAVEKQSDRWSADRQSADQQAADQQPALRLATVPPSNYTLEQHPDTYQQTVPGYAVMFVFFVVMYLSASIDNEKHNGTYRRLLSTPVSRASLLGSKLLSGLTIGLLQLAIMFAAGALIFGLNLGRDWPALLLLSVALVASATSIALAASTTPLSGGGVLGPLILGALLGGCMFPIDLMPRFLRVLSRLVPHSWALTGFHDLMVRGQGLLQVLPEIGVLLAFAGVFFLLAVFRFEFTE
jgi:ABC-2 type transport system permease protein